MPKTLDVEKVQQINDLRKRCLDNIRAGRDAGHGIDDEELREAMDALRGDRISVGRKAKKAKAKTVDPNLSLDELIAKANED